MNKIVRAAFWGGSFFAYNLSNKLKLVSLSNKGNVYESGRSEVPGYVIGAIGWAGFAVFYVWSIIDAVNVVRIKNMKFRDNNISFKIEPYFESGFQNRINANNTGVSLKILF